MQEVGKKNGAMKDKGNIKLIIPDAEFRKPFDVVNIMQQHYGYDCILCASKHKNLVLSFIYREKIYRLRHNNFAEFCSDFNSIIKTFTNSKLVYFPVSDKSISLFYQYIESNNADNLYFRLPPKSFFDLANDKVAFQKFCETKGYPVPGSYNKSDIKKIKGDFRPLILKPKSGQGSVGIQYFEKPQDLGQIKKLNMDNYILQDKIESDKKVAGAFFLCESGEVLNAYTHRRIRTYPVKSGSTVYSKSTYIEEIIEIGSELLHELKWEGLAMIEFMYDKFSERWVIIELNPRIWGSVLLSAFNNSDLLKGYVETCLGEKPYRNRRPKSVYIRWLFPFEFINLIRGEISLPDFFTLNRAKTCYINSTYAGWSRSFGYLLYFIFNMRSLKRFLKKIF